MGADDEETGLYRPADDDSHPDAPIDESTQFPVEEFNDDSPPTPRFLQDEREYRHFRWVPAYVRRIGREVSIWMKGPNPPKIHKIKPIFPSIQEAPLRLLDRYAPKQIHRIFLLVAVYICWIVTFGVVFRQSTYATEVEGYGNPIQISGGASFFVAGNGCGLNADNCRPFDSSSFAFRCPANSKETMVLNPRAVGAQEILYQPLVIGGPPEENPEGTPIYRGDSFICAAAIHAGIITNAGGGCGVVSLVGESRNYQSTKRHGITSIAFDSYFPQSFTFEKDVVCKARDFRWPLLGISMFFSALISLFTTSPPVYFFSIFVGLFFHVGLASDPPGHSSLAELFSNLLGKLLPATFCAFVVYQYVVRRTLTGLTAQVEKTILWLGACWLGCLSNYTFKFIPIQRLNAHDLNQQPGAKLALAIIVIIIACTIVQQVYNFRLEGRLPRYLALYVFFVSCLLLSLAIPGLSLRIHHYILGLLLLPGTSMQTRAVLLYQGLLVGFFINGVARWGFDSILQTPDELRGDAKLDSDLPILLEPIISLGLTMSNITFNWIKPPSPFNGISVLVNEVERFHSYLGAGFDSDKKFVWEREASLEEPEYFRFGYLQDTLTWDYTKAGIWQPDGEWIQMEAGPSKIKRALDAANRFNAEEFMI